MIKIKFRAQRQNGEWIYFMLEELATNSKLRAEWPKLKNQTEGTGLKDKNRVEIYKGDIIRKAKGVHLSSGSGNLSLAEKAMEVFWWNYKWKLKNKHGSTYHFGVVNCNPRAFEIIGNIYENPELLN